MRFWGDESEMPTCPVCGEECNTFFTSMYGNEIVGCEKCISEESAYERTQEDKLNEEIDRRYYMSL